MSPHQNGAHTATVNAAPLGGGGSAHFACGAPGSSATLLSAAPGPRSQQAEGVQTRRIAFAPKARVTFTAHMVYVPLDVDVVVNFGEYPELPPTESYSFVIDSPVADRDRGWDYEAFVSEIVSVVAAEPEGHLRPYSSEVKKSDFSWGAEGSSAQVAIYVAEIIRDGIVANLAWESVRSAYRRVVAHGRTPDLFEVSREDGAAMAVRRVLMVYPATSRSQLTVIGEQEGGPDNPWTYTIRDVEGHHYEVQFLMVDGGLVTRTARLPQ